MSAITHLKLGFAVAGVITWGYGVRADLSWLRWIGIGFLALAAALRFWGRWRRGADDGGASGPPPTRHS